MVKIDYRDFKSQVDEVKKSLQRFKRLEGHVFKVKDFKIEMRRVMGFVDDKTTYKFLNLYLEQGLIGKIDGDRGMFCKKNKPYEFDAVPVPKRDKEKDPNIFDKYDDYIFGGNEEC